MKLQMNQLRVSATRASNTCTCLKLKTIFSEYNFIVKEIKRNLTINRITKLLYFVFTIQKTSTE